MNGWTEKGVAKCIILNDVWTVHMVRWNGV